MTDVLLATDADWVVEEVAAALSAAEVTFRVVRSGHDVRAAVEANTPDLVILDFQIGNMGGMATCLDLRLESGVGRLPRVPVLMLADREADIFLARRSEADAWLVKPINPLLLRRTAQELLGRDAASTP
ncbi:response regulator transcription factor [Candidatus Poriferisodalis sp.]|uniref:response regulator transcription factor n=1 Tax=Candidatus Poriferisodalis sp. TaxID=3101277 RepID=UPI003B52EB8B